DWSSDVCSADLELRKPPDSVNVARTALLCTCGGLLVMRWLVLAAVVLGLLDGSRDVKHREHHEDERLEKRHEDLQGVQESDRERDHDDAAAAPHHAADG